jgi:transposase
MDNAKYQHCKIVMQMANELGINLLFLLSYSPSLNIIERLWKFTKRQILYAKYYDSPDKFHSAVYTLFDVINDNYHDMLSVLLSLNFQLFEYDEISQNHAV